LVTSLFNSLGGMPLYPIPQCPHLMHPREWERERQRETEREIKRENWNGNENANESSGLHKAAKTAANLYLHLYLYLYSQEFQKQQEQQQQQIYVSAMSQRFQNKYVCKYHRIMQKTRHSPFATTTKRENLFVRLPIPDSRILGFSDSRSWNLMPSSGGRAEEKVDKQEQR